MSRHNNESGNSFGLNSGHFFAGPFPKGQRSGNVSLVRLRYQQVETQAQ